MDEQRRPHAQPDRIEDALARGPVLLDGGLATELEAQGKRLDTPMWSARLLMDDPAAIRRAHLAYFEAGARVATTASYQASYDGLGAAGLDRAAATRVMRLSVELARQARAELDDVDHRWIAGSVGPYGAALADGSEYRGDYGLSASALGEWHRPRLHALIEAGADVLALETVPCLAEAEALLNELSGTGVPCWLSLTCVGERTRAGEAAAEAFAWAGEVGEVVAVGVNCTDPQDVAGLVRAAAAASGKPVVVYPNSGERWDQTSKVWRGPSRFDAGAVAGWVADGARLIGGCCRVGPADIAALGRLLNSAAPPLH